MRHNGGGCILVYVCVHGVCITNARVFLLLLPISFFYSQPPSPKGAIQNECVVLPILRSIKDKIDLSLIRLKL
jgi:hypothetical protein